MEISLWVPGDSDVASAGDHYSVCNAIPVSIGCMDGIDENTSEPSVAHVGY